MDIRASLVFDNLRDQFSVIRYGTIKDNPLQRPVFYSKNSVIEKGRIYVARPDSFPQKQLLDNTMLLICVEGLPSLAYQHGNTPILAIPDATIMDVFNAILGIFEKYENWEKSISNILATNADISDLIQVTAPLLMNDITVVNKDLRVIAAANYQLNKAGQPEMVHHTPLMEAMSLDIVNRYRIAYEENARKRGAFFSDEGCYCVNLYVDNLYWGSVSLFPRLTPLRASDPYVFDVLADAVLNALHINTVSVHKKMSVLEQITRKLIDGVPIAPEKIAAYESNIQKSMQGRFVVLSILPPDDLRKMSVDYVCQALHNRYPNLVIFQHENYLLGIKDFSNCAIGYDRFVELLKLDMNEFGLKMGISNRFNHLRHVRNYYQQALCALEYGIATSQENALYFFEQYALRYMLINSSGSFPARYLCPQSMIALQKYNESSNVDYWHTLRCYLDSERSIAHTSKTLGIHRNTMIQRIERLQTILDIDLDDPMNRLWLRMAMWLVDEESMKSLDRPI